MDELTRYVLNNYHHLMTVREYKAKTTAMAAIISAGEQEITRPADQRAEIEKKFVSKYPEVQAMLTVGPEICLRRLRQRILRDYPREVFLNCCPQCQGLARTPQAKQCQHCFFSWHDTQ